MSQKNCCEEIAVNVFHAKESVRYRRLLVAKTVVSGTQCIVLGSHCKLISRNEFFFFIICVF